MNGRAARRIRRAVWPTMRGSGDSWNKVHAQLKREYKANPYHKRKGIGYVVLSHKMQELRWWGMRNEQVPIPTPRPKAKAKPVEEQPFYDDHARFKFMEGR